MTNNHKPNPDDTSRSIEDVLSDTDRAWLDESRRNQPPAPLPLPPRHQPWWQRLWRALTERS